MRLNAPLALVAIFLIAPQPVLRAQDSEAKIERAIAEIKKLGGKVEVDAKSAGTPVVSVDLKHTKAVDASLEHLKGLTRVQILFLKDTEVTDDGLVYLKGLTDLEALELGRTKVTDKGLEHLKRFAKLQSLDLGGSQVTDKGLEHIQGLTRLETLSLENVKGVSDRGLVRLKGLTNLRTLNLAGGGRNPECPREPTESGAAGGCSVARPGAAGARHPRGGGAGGRGAQLSPAAHPRPASGQHAGSRAGGQSARPAYAQPRPGPARGPLAR
jgi:hypothetical protein